MTVVVPTTGRPGLRPLLQSLLAADDAEPPEVVVVDDRPDPVVPLPIGGSRPPRLVASGGRGPAAARNAGLREASGEWVVFVDDDSELVPGWYAELRRELGCARHDVAGVRGRILASLGDGRTSSEAPAATRPGATMPATAAPPGLAADMAYRRLALLCVGGFEERFPRACREDAELALRVLRSGWRLVQGGGRSTVGRPTAWWRARDAEHVLLGPALMSGLAAIVVGPWPRKR